MCPHRVRHNPVRLVFDTLNSNKTEQTRTKIHPPPVKHVVVQALPLVRFKIVRATDTNTSQPAISLMINLFRTEPESPKSCARSTTPATSHSNSKAKKTQHRRPQMTERGDRIVHRRMNKQQTRNANRMLTANCESLGRDEVLIGNLISNTGVEKKVSRKSQNPCRKLYTATVQLLQQAARTGEVRGKSMAKTVNSALSVDTGRNLLLSGELKQGTLKPRYGVQKELNELLGLLRELP